MKRHGISALVSVTFLLAIALVGCSKSGPTGDGQQAPRLTASGANASGGYVDPGVQEYTTSKMGDLKQHVPFPLNAPSYLPAGYAFTSGTVTPGPLDNTSNVYMTFAAGNEAAIIVAESRDGVLYEGYPAETGTVTTTVQLGGVTAKVDTSNQNIIIVNFKVKGLYHEIHAVQVPEAEVLKVAESLCR